MALLLRQVTCRRNSPELKKVKSKKSKKQQSALLRPYIYAVLSNSSFCLQAR